MAPKFGIGVSRRVTVIRYAGTQREKRWDEYMGGDFDQKALFPRETIITVNDEIRGDWFDEPRIIVDFGPVVVLTGLSHWRATMVPYSEWRRRREHQRDVAAKAAGGRPFPKPMFHATKPPRTVYSPQQKAELGQEWSEEYIFQPYPKYKYHWVHKERTVQNLEEESTLRNGWGDSPNEFAPYRGTRPNRSDAQDPTKWVDDWLVSGLSASHRNKIKAQLLRADAVFWNAPDANSADLASMKVAFEGIAKVLFEAGLLTRQLLQNEIPVLAWDSAIAGGWYRFASEIPESIFPEPLGHYWVWRDETKDWKGLFRPETAQWLAMLLEHSTDRPASPTAHRAVLTSSRTATDFPVEVAQQPGDQANASCVSQSAGETQDQSPAPELTKTQASTPEDRLSRFMQAHTGTTYADVKYSANVHTADFQDWRKEKLKATSVMSQRIEDVLSGTTQLKKKPPKSRPD